VKPHASPVFHAIQYLFGHQTRDKLENFRGYKGAQSYPSRTKDADDVDFSTGSVGLGVAQTLFSSLVQDYVTAHGWMNGPAGGADDRAGRRCPRWTRAISSRRCWKAGSTGCAHLVDRRLQPPEPRCRGAQPVLPAFQQRLEDYCPRPLSASPTSAIIRPSGRSFIQPCR